MSIVATRTALAAALNEVDDLTGYAYAPNIYKPGDAWPQWGGAEPPEDGRYRANFVHTFRVVLILPADGQAADVFTDAHMDAVVDALADILSVTQIGYTRLPGEGTQAAYNALIITGETE